MDVAMDKDQKKMLGLGLVAAVMFLFMRIDPSDVRAAGRWFKQGHWLAPTLVVVTVISSGFVGVKGYRLKKQRQAQAEITERIATGPTVLLLPRSDWKPVDPLKVNLWGRLADALPHDEQVSLEVFGNGLEIAFALHASENGLRAALTQIKAEWPGIQRRTVSDDPTHLPEGWAIYWCECVPAVWDRPVTSITPDPLRAALVELNAVMGRGRGMLQIIAKNDFGTKRICVWIMMLAVDRHCGKFLIILKLGTQVKALFHLEVIWGPPFNSGSIANMSIFVLEGHTIG